MTTADIRSRIWREQNFERLGSGQGCHLLGLPRERALVDLNSLKLNARSKPIHLALHTGFSYCPPPVVRARSRPLIFEFPQGDLSSQSLMEKVPMTDEGYKALDEELRRLKSVERPSVIAAIAEARSHGDLSENAEYHAAKERQGWIEGRIAEIEDKISRAQVIDVSKLSGSQVKFGATVTVLDEDTEEQARYQVVGEHEADVKKGRLSLTSPLARGMIGKTSGDVFEVQTPAGVKAYEILKVEWI
jgi:transcription elongation factor GreA